MKPSGDMHVVNAEIASASLSYKDRGVLTSFLQMRFDGSGQGFGGYVLTKKADDPHAAAGAWIMGILETLEVNDWSDLPGTYCRVVRDSDKYSALIIGIGHITKDQWYFIEPSMELARKVMK